MLVHHDSRDYNVAASEAAKNARGKMEAMLDKGRKEATALIERVHTVVPQDAIVKAGAITFEPDASGVLRASFGGTMHGIHNNALGQMAQKAKIPGDYLNRLADGEGWERDLAAEVLNRHFKIGMPNTRHLVRSVGENKEIRGFLSDRYRRLDSRPLLDAFAESCGAVGAMPVEGVASDLRYSLKAFLPMIFEPVPNEVMCLGVEWGNSDFGKARHTVRAFIWRLWCTNLATMEDSLAQVHLGAKLDESIEFSNRTYELDTKTSVSALKDIVKGLLAPQKVNALLATIKAADAKKVDWKSMRTALAKKLLKSELEAIENAYKSEDVYNLPAGESNWRASNAVSWIAKQTEDADRRLELQRVAGWIVNGKADAAVAEAA